MNSARAIGYLVLAILTLALAAPSFGGVFVSVRIGPPPLPVYVQPPCPGDGYLWTPGYWAYGPDGYYWVPGTWVLAPEPGLLWTPGYWAWSDGLYMWHAGYWGPRVGFYGGINYGFGYFGTGYAGGYWSGRRFYYNRTVNNIHITNVHVYNRTVVRNVTVNRVSYNGGRGGINARPSRFEQTAYRERHFEPTHRQMEHEHAARNDRSSWASQNHGRPQIAATPRPGEFNRHDSGRDRAMNGRDRYGNQDAPRPGNSSRNDRPVFRQESYGNHGGPLMQNPSRPDNGPRSEPMRGTGNGPRMDGGGRGDNAPRRGGNGGEHGGHGHGRQR